MTFQNHGGALGERICGAADGAPSAALLGDTMLALYIAVGILSALVAGDKTGTGTYIDIAMSDAVLTLQTSFIAGHETEYEALPQRDPGHALYETSDGGSLTTSIAYEDAYWDQLRRDVQLAKGISLTRPQRLLCLPIKFRACDTRPAAPCARGGGLNGEGLE
ncbi:CoA transferase [Citreicella sp. C3M06]|uniref:CoA transferase n=1 Tax=Citreicella sp. C3M06 TaxID=2841564 RepID=UPI001C09AD76|nr:CoA transferase [Citreicella sp. C3M06]